MKKKVKIENPKKTGWTKTVIGDRALFVMDENGVDDPPGGADDDDESEAE